MTTPEQWPRIKEVLGAALACEPSGRSVFLDEACSGNAELRAEIESLIAAYDEADELSSPGWGTAAFRDDSPTPSTIGPYRLERELGAGGMGQVWLAEQTEPVRRHVALKLIRSDFYDRETAQRFLSERQSLALMNHPAIAKVFDAGTTTSGQPYLVMEYVDGCPITEYCDRHKLSIPERLKLFQLVCDGVQHAHQKAIIHRDLKPTNILVTEVDGKPAPRIIDFGIAKTLTQGSEEQALLTQAGAIVGTLGYMSPEQADGGNADVDTRSDVYSLGVILYELLAGELPFDRGSSSYFEMLRTLREQDAPRPSTKVRASDQSSTIAEKRKTSLVVLTRQLRGDADAIVMKAIEKNPEQRYVAPAALSADIDRYLNNEPVSAHTASAGYFARKYIRRHRVGIAVAAIVMVLIISFATVQTIQLNKTRRERDRADRITDFMTDMFKVSDPSQSRGNSITAREILDRSSHRIEAGLGFDSTVQSQLMQVMAKTYYGLGLYKDAQKLAEKNLAIRQKTLGPDDPKTFESMTQLAEILDDEGHSAESETSLRTTIDKEKRVLGAENPTTLATQNDLGRILWRHAHYIEAETIERQIIPIEVRRLGATDLQTFNSRNNLCSALQGQSRFAEAERLFRELLDAERRALGADHPYVLVTMNNLANMYADQDRYAEAEALYRETLAIEQHVLGPEHPDTADTMCTLANTIGLDDNRHPEAEALYRQVIAIESRTVGPDHPYTNRAKEGLANQLSADASAAGGSASAAMRTTQYAESQRLLEEVLATRARTLGPNDTDTLLTGYNLANVLSRQHEDAAAEKLMRRTLETQSRVLDPNDPDTFASRTMLASILLKEGHLEEAESLAHQAFDAQLRVLGPGHSDTQQSLGYLTEAMARQGRFPQAQELWLDMIGTIKAEGKSATGDAWYHFAEASAVAEHKDDSLICLRRAVEAGFNDIDYLKIDPKLAAVRNDPRYRQVLAAAQTQAGSHP